MMRFILALLICLCTLTIAGCGGGGGNAPAVKGTVSGGARAATVTAVSFYEQGHAGEADHLIASTTGPGKALDTTPFEIRDLHPGIYDVQVSYEFWLEMTDPLRKFQGETVFPGIQTSGSQTDVGDLNLQLWPYF